MNRQKSRGSAPGLWKLPPVNDKESVKEIMKRIVAFVLVALLSGFCGYYIGSSQNTHIPANTPEKQEVFEDFKAAYKKGWVAWFTGYGLKGEGMQYMSHYIYGRNYDDVFINSKDAFFAGYKDGFYAVNNREPEGYEETIEKAYEKYYLN